MACPPIRHPFSGRLPGRRDLHTCGGRLTGPELVGKGGAESHRSVWGVGFPTRRAAMGVAPGAPITFEVPFWQERFSDLIGPYWSTYGIVSRALQPLLAPQASDHLYGRTMFGRTRSASREGTMEGVAFR